MAETRFGAVVLAGGKSTRLGRDKASEPLLGVPLLQRVLARLDGIVEEFVVVKARDQVLPDLATMMPLSVVEDLYPESGPLGGLYTGLSATRCDAVVAVACDMPLLRPQLLQELICVFPGHDVVVPVSETFAQPLCALYSRACIEPIRRRLEAGELKLMSFYEDVRVLEVPAESWRKFDPEGLSFQNLNRDEDLARAEALLRAEESAEPI